MEKRKTAGQVALCALLACSAAALPAACASDKPRLVVPGENSVELARAATRAQRWLEAAGRWNDLYLSGGADAHEACRETARALWKIDRPDDAKALLDDGLRRWPDDPELLTLQGNLLAALGFRRAAEMSFARSLEIHGDQPDTWLALARVRLELGLEEGSRAACRRRLELAGACRETYVVLAEASASAGDFACAYESWSMAFSLAPGTLDELFTAGSMYEAARGRSKLAVVPASSRAWLLQATEIDPQHTEAHYLLGMIAEDADELDSALQHYRRAAQTDPAHLPSLVRLIELHGRRGELPQSEAIAAAARKTFEKDRVRYAEIKRAIGRARAAAQAQELPGPPVPSRPTESKPDDAR